MSNRNAVLQSLKDATWRTQGSLETFVSERDFYRAEFSGSINQKPDARAVTYNFYLNRVDTGYAQINIVPPAVELVRYFPFQWIVQPELRHTRFGSVCLYVVLSDVERRIKEQKLNIEQMVDDNPQTCRMQQREKLGISEYGRAPYSLAMHYKALEVFLKENDLLIFAKNAAANIKDAKKFGEPIPDPVCLHMTMLGVEYVQS